MGGNLPAEGKAVSRLDLGEIQRIIRVSIRAGLEGLEGGTLGISVCRQNGNDSLRGDKLGRIDGLEGLLAIEDLGLSRGGIFAVHFLQDLDDLVIQLLRRVKYLGKA